MASSPLIGRSVMITTFVPPPGSGVWRAKWTSHPRELGVRTKPARGLSFWTALSSLSVPCSTSTVFRVSRFAGLGPPLNAASRWSRCVPVHLDREAVQEEDRLVLCGGGRGASMGATRARRNATRVVHVGFLRVMGTLSLQDSLCLVRRRAEPSASRQPVYYGSGLRGTSPETGGKRGVRDREAPLDGGPFGRLAHGERELTGPRPHQAVCMARLTVLVLALAPVVLEAEFPTPYPLSREAFMRDCLPSWASWQASRAPSGSSGWPLHAD